MILLLAVASSLAFQAPVRSGPQAPRGASVVRPQNDLRLYLATAAQYGSGIGAGALREIRQWSLHEVARATAALRREQVHLRSQAKDPDDIDFHTVEAAVLMHAQAGILFLQVHQLRPAKLHFDASSEILQWSRKAAAEERNWTTMRKATFKDRPPDPALELTESINPRDFYVALASAALSLGYAEAASPYAEQARLEAPLNPVVQLVAGCVASGLAVEKALQHRDADASRARRPRKRHSARPSRMTRPRTRRGCVWASCSSTRAARPRRSHCSPKSSPRPRTNASATSPVSSWAGPRSDSDGPKTPSVRTARALEAWPSSQAARLGLAHALEESSGPGASREIVGAMLDASRRTDGPSDPWFLYPIGPPGLAQAAFNRVWDRTAVVP